MNYGRDGFDSLTDLLLTPDGGYLLCGSSDTQNNGLVTGNHGLTDYWVVKVGSEGSLEWQKSFGGSQMDIAKGLAIASDGNYLIAGISMSADGDITAAKGDNDYWVVKCDLSGNMIWQHSYGGMGLDDAWGILAEPDGGAIVCGFTQFSPSGDITEVFGISTTWLASIDAGGSLEWQLSLGGSGSDFAAQLLHTSDGGYIFTGYGYSFTPFGTGNHDYWTVKLADATAGLEDFSAQESVKVYPNPVSAVVQVESHFGMGAWVLYDAGGREIRRRSLSGQLQSEQDCSDISSGLYQLSVETASGISNRKIIVR